MQSRRRITEGAEFNLTALPAFVSSFCWKLIWFAHKPDVLIWVLYVFFFFLISLWISGSMSWMYWREVATIQHHLQTVQFSIAYSIYTAEFAVPDFNLDTWGDLKHSLYRDHLHLCRTDVTPVTSTMTEITKSALHPAHHIQWMCHKKESYVGAFFSQECWTCLCCWILRSKTLQCMKFQSHPHSLKEKQKRTDSSATLLENVM